MQTRHKILVAGGDARNARLACLLSMDGHKVECIGIERDHTVIKSGMGIPADQLEEVLADKDLVIGPIPFTLDGVRLNTPLSDEQIQLSRFLSGLIPGCALISGMIPIPLVQFATSRGIHVCDLLEREDMAVLNAIPTAEGALQLAMEEIPVTMNGIHALVLGFGRVGKILCKILQGMGAEVCADAADPVDAAWIRGYGYLKVDLDQLETRLPWAEVIFNTVPALILDRSRLSLLSPECVVIEIASKPGGLDLQAAKDLKLKVIHAPSLPGKVAPVSSARSIRETVYHIIEEREG
ncbi:MAG TPA: dipicolinate synthase subunit DpsA [Clostridiales bacterium]|nr:dipicolinate synthase subunit DpsA [Clostridiales bacterium]